MNYVFYDLETTGRSVIWDQIIQVAAVLTDNNLNIIEKYEEKCRINSFCIPNPEAILVNKISTNTLLNANLSHYQLMLNIRNKFLKWSPAIFIGYNSIKFDEEFLRNSFFKNLFDPYITTKKNNYRFDLLDTVRATNHFYPDKIKSNISEKGNPILKLDNIAPLNGISNFKAHDALGDTIATIELAKVIKKEVSSIWETSISNKSKAFLQQYITENPFCYIESFFGRIKTFVLSFIGEHPNYKWAVCFDLIKDPSEALNLNNQEFDNYMDQSPRVVRNIKLNKSPLILPYNYISFIDTYNGIDEKVILKRYQFIKDNPLFKEKVISYFERKTSNSIYEADQSDLYAEETIYKKFISYNDSDLMHEFHSANWESKNIIKKKFKDDRLKYFADILIYEENPETLEKNNFNLIKNNIKERLLSNNNEGWLTLYNAYKKIDDLREKCDNENDSQSLTLLEEVNDYLEILEKKLNTSRN